MDPFERYLKEGLLLEKKREARRLLHQSARYVLYDRKLYRREFSRSLLRCVSEKEAKVVLQEIHEG